MGSFGSIGEAAPLIFAILVALTFHEAAHAWVADKLGDPTPRLAGRLTLNPLAHLDWLGAVMFFLVKIGWAKPVPVNPGYFRNPRKGFLLVSLAGVTANFALAIVFALIWRVAIEVVPLRPVTTFDRVLVFVVMASQAGVWVNVGLGLFNLIPIPPLDGANVVGSLLPPKQAHAFRRLGRYGFIVLFALVFSGALRHTLFPLLDSTARLLMGL